jgi:hypothetical protein
MAIRDEQAHHHHGSYPATFDATCRALVGLGMTISFADPATGTIEAASSMSLASWGENLKLQVGAVDASTTAVTVTSSLKFGLVDWGKNRKNIGRIHEAIVAALGTAPGAQPVGGAPAAPPVGAWHPDPAGRHELRWWDGQRWTESVSDGGATSTDPL